MYIVHAEHGKAICLGREGENLARQVVFDVAEWRALYGEGVVQLIAQRMGDTQPYPCVVEMDGDHAVWTITNADTAKPGNYGNYGKCELSYYVGETLVKSETWPTIVLDAMCEPSKGAPEPYQAWVDKVLAASAEATEGATKAGGYVVSAHHYAGAAEASAKNAALSEQNAEALARQVGVSGGLQADWGVNDPAAPGYVHYRTHWVEYVVTQEILPETEAVYTNPPDNTQLGIRQDLNLVEGEVYRVTYNGVDYDCVCGYSSNPDNGSSFYWLGNLLDDNVECPFEIITGITLGNGVKHGVTFIEGLDGATSVVISIKQGEEIIHPIPSKFLRLSAPDGSVYELTVANDGTLGTILVTK